MLKWVETEFLILYTGSPKTRSQTQRRFVTSGSGNMFTFYVGFISSTCHTCSPVLKIKNKVTRKIQNQYINLEHSIVNFMYWFCILFKLYSKYYTQ